MTGNITDNYTEDRNSLKYKRLLARAQDAAQQGRDAIITDKGVSFSQTFKVETE